MKVLMTPSVGRIKKITSGIDQVVVHYAKHLPKVGIELVDESSDNFDLLAVHIASPTFEVNVPIVQILHGLHWTADYAAPSWEYKVNSGVIETLRHAKEVTVPSSWVAEPLMRDMRFTPHTIPHGVDVSEWEHEEDVQNYVLWNKNRYDPNICNPIPVMELARRFQDRYFVTTFIPPNTTVMNNVQVTGMIPHNEMKPIIQKAFVYLATVKETGGIGILEAMASGVPVVGFRIGAITDLVQHGICGYLAEPGNYDDLSEGLNYCFNNRRVLGENAREVARQFTWESACEKLRGVFDLAMVIEPPAVGVVIPVFNKTEEQVRRAVQSVLGQTCGIGNETGVQTLVVVNDGSDEGTSSGIDRVVAEAIERYPQFDVRSIKQPNSGVAVARNRGISELGTRYVLCLDSDDALEPEFIATCVKALEEDRSLGIAYTGLRYIKPDGETGVSQWPEQFDYNKQLQRRNQVPTACVFRREMWERTGGYNPKYSPGGAGSEDAELWLRAGSIGYGARKVTDKPLFIYSWQSGIVSGDPHYHEIDWTELMPWAGKDGDDQHPFASVATPQRWSHPVRQYDSPSISVVIPVGPGHEESVRNALDSLEHQTMRKWEAIVVDDTTKDIWTLRDSLKPYPYIRYLDERDVWTATDGAIINPRGAGFSRNRGVEIARAPFIVFLDADDFLYPRCLERMLQEWNEQSAIIYTDYVGKAFVEDPSKLDPALQKNLYHYDERTKEAVIGHKAADYSCEKAQKQPQGEIPYLWCNVTALIPKAWHYEIGGFDEEMPSWEDVDYHWRMAKRGKCYTRIPEELLVYQFHTGHRREKGRQGFRNLLDYLREKHRKEKVMPCRGCGGSRRAPNRSTHQPVQQAQAQVAAMSDDIFVMCSYNHPNLGSHQVYGAVGFTQRVPGLPMTRLRDGKYHINYGYRAGGGKESFLVHKQDASTEPMKFIPVDTGPVTTAPKVEKEELAPPEPIAATQEMPIDEPVPVTGPSIEPVERPFDLQVLPGVGGALAQQLREAGVMSTEDVLNLGVEGLQKFSGVGPVKAENIIDAILAMP
jgi:glycosyltransferase involved in cell wall biosynthesis/predicted flap endonuclease-1-like 5' DNA nuclease